MDKQIKVLEKRRDHLVNRINKSTDKRLTYDEAEVSALNWAINKLKEINGKDEENGKENSISG